MNAISNNIIYKNDRSALYILAANNFSQLFDADLHDFPFIHGY